MSPFNFLQNILKLIYNQGMENTPTKLGRPTLYDAEKHCELATNYCLLGCTDEQLADFFDVHVDTIYEWKKVHPEFSEAIKKGKEQADAMVAQSLFHRALGYSHPEDDIRTCDNNIVITPTIKHYPPDTTAAIFWLKNRRKENWRDKTEQDVNATVTAAPSLADFYGGVANATAANSGANPDSDTDQ